MLQRTKGRLLLALLVVTGLAGTLSDNTLTPDERKTTVTLYKEGRTKILGAADGLSAAQLNYRPDKKSWTIAECLAHIALTEEQLWSVLEISMEAPPVRGLRDSIKMNDGQLLATMADRSQKRKTSPALEPSRTSSRDAASSIAAFKKMRNDHIRYIRSTTEDLRNHVMQVQGSFVDGYQMLLLVYGHAERHYAQIAEIKASSGFPKK